MSDSKMHKLTALWGKPTGTKADENEAVPIVPAKKKPGPKPKVQVPKPPPTPAPATQEQEADAAVAPLADAAVATVTGTAILPAGAEGPIARKARKRQKTGEDTAAEPEVAEPEAEPQPEAAAAQQDGEEGVAKPAGKKGVPKGMSNGAWEAEKKNDGSTRQQAKWQKLYPWHGMQACACSPACAPGSKSCPRTSRVECMACNANPAIRTKPDLRGKKWNLDIHEKSGLHQQSMELWQQQEAAEVPAQAAAQPVHGPMDVHLDKMEQLQHPGLTKQLQMVEHILGTGRPMRAYEQLYDLLETIKADGLPAGRRGDDAGWDMAVCLGEVLIEELQVLARVG